METRVEAATRRPRARVAIALLSVVVLLLAGCDASAPDAWSIVDRVSVRWSFDQANGLVDSPAFSADGRFVAFSSEATNLASGDTNGASDVFVYDRQTGAVERVSVAGDGTQANGRSLRPSISGDGRYVAFYSTATNLVPGNHGGSDVFVHDRQTGETRWVSFGMGGVESDLAADNPAISTDGSVVAFDATSTNLVPGDTNGQGDVFAWDRGLDRIDRVSVGSGGTANGLSFNASVSGDGRYVAFVSTASNLIGGDTNAATDVFVRDRLTGETDRVDVATNGAQADLGAYWATISASGQAVGFLSRSTNLSPPNDNRSAQVYVRDLVAGRTLLASVASDGAPGNSDSAGGIAPALSADGRIVAFVSYATNFASGVTNGQANVFVHEFDSGRTEWLNVAADGTPADRGTTSLSISGDGQRVAFASPATNLAPRDTNGVSDVFVVDRAAPSIVRVTANCTATDANGPSYSPIATPDGRLIAFESEASNLVAGDTNGLMDIFVADRATGAFELVSVGLGGAPANGPSSLGDATPDGRYIVFESYASNLVPGDTNGVPDIFVRDRTAGVTTRVSVAGDGSEANWYSMGGSLSADGQVVAFVSGATNLVPGDANRTYDVFVRDLAAGTTERVDAVATGTEPNDAAVTALLSADGRFVYFVSMASNLVPGDENEGIDVFSYDRTLGVVERLTELVYPGQETAWSGGVAFSDDGRYLALTGAPGSTVSSARGIVFDRVANGVTDILAGEPPLSLDASVGPLSPDGSLVVVRGRNRFYVPDGWSDGGFAVFNRTTGTRTLVAESGYEGTFLENGEGLSLDSRFALMPGDTNELSDVYIAHRAPGVDPYAGPKCGR